MGNDNHDELGRFAESPGGSVDCINYASAGARRGDPSLAKTGDRTTDAVLKDSAFIKADLDRYEKLKASGLKKLAEDKAKTAAHMKESGAGLERLNYSSANMTRKK